MFSQEFLRSNLQSLMIGNEIDNFNPGADGAFWTDYGAFLFDVAAYINSNYASLDVGFTVTYEGLIDSTKVLPPTNVNAVATFSAWAGVVDVVGVTYYPKDANFQYVGNSVVSTQFQSLANFTLKPIHIQEAGLASAAANLSNEAKQAEFFCEVLHAWDTHASRIPNLAPLRMNDLTRSAAESMAIPYGITSETFIEYLRTLGIKTEPGVKKQAFALIESELTKRGF